MSKKPSQSELPGVEREKIPAVEKAAKKYLDNRDTRMEWTKKETDSRAVLIHEMREHKLTSYQFDDQLVTLEAKDKVKIKTLSDDDGKADGDDED